MGQGAMGGVLQVLTGSFPVIGGRLSAWHAAREEASNGDSWALAGTF